MAVMLGLTLGAAGSASAHDSLVASDPASGSTVTLDPGTVSLTFNEPLLALGGETNGFAIVVTAPDGRFQESGCITVADTVASTTVALGAAGTYTVVWQVVSSDGHATSGTYTFTYSPAADALINPGMDAAPACGEPWAGALVTAVGTPAPIAVATPAATIGTAVPVVPTEGNTPNVPLIAAISIGSVLALVAGLVVILRRIRNDPFTIKDDAGDE